MIYCGSVTAMDGGGWKIISIIEGGAWITNLIDANSRVQSNSVWQIASTQRWHQTNIVIVVCGESNNANWAGVWQVWHEMYVSDNAMVMLVL